MVDAMFCIHHKCTEKRKLLHQKTGSYWATWYVRDIFKTFDLRIKTCPDCGFPLDRRKFTKRDINKLERQNGLRKD